MQSEPNLCDRNQNEIQLKLQIDIIQREHTGVSNSHKKGPLSYLNLTIFLLLSSRYIRVGENSIETDT